MDYSSWGRKESDKIEPLCMSMNFSRGFPSHSRKHQMPYIYSGGSGVVTKSYLTLTTPRTVAHQAPLSMEFSRQASWSGLPFPSPGDLSNAGIKPRSPAPQQILYQLTYHGSLV